MSVHIPSGDTTLCGVVSSDLTSQGRDATCRQCIDIASTITKNEKSMTAYTFIVTVEAKCLDDAQQVMIERIHPDEDYGFDYTIDWIADPLAIDGEAP